MASFDLDDPLGDLLSEGSNDSFFEEPKVLAKKASLTKTPEKKAISDLFGLAEKSDDKNESKRENKTKGDDWLGLNDDIAPKESEIKSGEARERNFARPASKPLKKISFDDDDDDLFGSLGLDSKKDTGRDKGKSDAQIGKSDTQSFGKDPQRLGAAEGKKASLMDSILGTGNQKLEEKSLGTSFEDILKESRAKAVDMSRISESTSKTQETPAQKGGKAEPPKFGFSSLDAPREGRRSRGQAANLMDSLGFLSGESREPEFKKPESSRQEILPSPTRRRETLPMKVPAEKFAQNLDVQMGRGESDMGVKTEVLYSAASKDLKTKSAPNLTELPDWLGGSGMRTHKSDQGLNNLGVSNTGGSQGDNPNVGSNAGSQEQMRLDQSSYTSVGSSNITTGAGNVSFGQNPPSSQTIADHSRRPSTGGPSIGGPFSGGPLTGGSSVGPSLGPPFTDTAPFMETLVAQQKLATSNMEYQNTSLALQQQESQLMMALQLKKYEENLSGMQRQQQEVLMKQEQQFNSLLERQFAKQQIMENNMRLQQERINNHIQMLINQPPVAGSLPSEEVGRVAELRKENSEEIVKLYEQMIGSLKQHQHEELFLLEESYKKQITTLEATSESVESRIKSENESLKEKHKEKLAQLNAEHEEEIRKLKDKIGDLVEQHRDEIKRVRDNQNVIIEEIKYEYATMVENIKQTKTSEATLFENANVYSQKLDVSLKMLDVNSRALLEIKDKVEGDYGVLNVAREESIKSREEEIKLMREALQKARDSAETERSQLMGLVRVLETKLAEQNQNSREERWALQQATATLTARAAALDRESEYTRSSLEQERAQIKTMKENLLAEQERLLLQLTEEKLAVSAEKSRLETLSKLQKNYDAKKGRAEVDAAIQAASEATEQTYQEREMLHRQQYELENMKRQVEEKERRLASREHNLESLTKNAERKGLEGEKALNEAKNMEAAYNRQLREIQVQLTSLAVREKKLAEEKISLSKERLALRSLQRMNKQCSLCNVETEYSSLKPGYANIKPGYKIMEESFDAEGEKYGQQAVNSHREDVYSQRGDNYTQRGDNYGQREDNFSQKRDNYGQRGNDYSQMVENFNDKVAKYNLEVEQDVPQFLAVSDPELLRLRFEVENDNFNTN